MLDEDVVRIEFEEFNSEIDNIYPTISLCFPSPLSEDKLANYGEGITVSTYSSFITGESGSWDDRMAQIDYDDVSLNIEDYFLGKIHVYLAKHTRILYKNNTRKVVSTNYFLITLSLYRF